MIEIRNFCLGISKPLNVFNKEIKSLVNLCLKNKIYFHISISYPLTFYLLRILVNKKKLNEVKFISKILGDTEKNFIKSFNLTLEKFSIERLYITQIINLPVRNIYKRVYEEINFHEFSKIINRIQLLKNKGFIKKNYIQLNPGDDIEFTKKIIKYFDGVSFYANIDSIFINQSVYDYIRKNNIPCLLLSIFGNPKEKNIESLNIDSYIYSQRNFSVDTIAVGRTYNLKRFKKMIEHDYSNENLKIKNKKLIFSFREEYQEKSETFFEHYQITNVFFLARFLFVCLLKSLLHKNFYNKLKIFKIFLSK